MKRGILEHYKYVEIKKFGPAFVSEKLKELYDVHLGKSQGQGFMDCFKSADRAQARGQLIGQEIGPGLVLESVISQSVYESNKLAQI